MRLKQALPIPPDLPDESAADVDEKSSRWVLVDRVAGTAHLGALPCAPRTCAFAEGAPSLASRDSGAAPLPTEAEAAHAFCILSPPPFFNVAITMANARGSNWKGLFTSHPIDLQP